jgi:hypothetical protein
VYVGRRKEVLVNIYMHRENIRKSRKHCLDAPDAKAKVLFLSNVQ